jgi:hypothetical protein
MKLPSRKTVLFYAGAIGFMAVVFGIIIGVKKIVAAGALTTPPELKPLAWVCGLATMWGTVGVSRLARRLNVFSEESKGRQALRVVVNVAAMAAVMAGFFAALFNVPGGEIVILRMLLYMATMLSGGATFRMAIF